jgi:hypothetical protein
VSVARGEGTLKAHQLGTVREDKLEQLAEVLLHGIGLDINPESVVFAERLPWLRRLRRLPPRRHLSVLLPARDDDAVTHPDAEPAASHKEENEQSLLLQRAQLLPRTPWRPNRRTGAVLCDGLFWARDRWLPAAPPQSLDHRLGLQH